MPVLTIRVGDDYNENLKTRLTKHGISQRQLALRAGLDPSQVSRWFTSGTVPTMKNIQKLEQALYELIREKEKEKKSKRKGAANKK